MHLRFVQGFIGVGARTKLEALVAQIKGGDIISDNKPFLGIKPFQKICSFFCPQYASQEFLHLSERNIVHEWLIHLSIEEYPAPEFPKTHMDKTESKSVDSSAEEEEDEQEQKYIDSPLNNSVPEVVSSYGNQRLLSKLTDEKFEYQVPTTIDRIKIIKNEIERYRVS